MFFSNGRRAIAIMARRMSVVTAASRVETRAIQTFPHQANGGTTSTSNAAARFQSSSSSPSSLGDYFGSLRVKAAQALTSTLPEEEKKQFLEKMAGETIMDPNDPEQLVSNDEDEAEEASIHRQHSINEAVAAARAREAERYEEKWEKEKEKLMAEAEEAALRRVESDLEIQRRQLAFEAWKRDLERDQQQQQQDAPSTASSAQSREEALGEHPILGPVIADLGSKRIHAASARALAAIPVWKKQRIYRHGRAKSMARDKIKSLHLGLPGVIGLYEGNDGSLSIIDGQHRIGMLKAMEETSASDGFDFDKILVEVYPQLDQTDKDKHAKDIFLEINKAEPVKLVDLPGMAKASDRKVINEGADRLHDKFPDMFSSSQRCRAPHLNIDNLRDALFASNVLQRHSLKTPKALEEWMLAQNEILSTKFQSEESRMLFPERAIAKAEKHDFYLGLDSSWLYH